MALITSNMRKQASLIALAMAALFSHSLVIPVMSTTEYYSPKPSTTITPPAGDTPANINCNNPPHGGSGGGGGGGSDGHNDPSRSPPSAGGYHYSPPPYTPTTPTPTIPTPPKTPVVTPPTTDTHTPTPSTPNPTPSTPTYTPRIPTVAPPTVPHTPTVPIPTTPPSVGTPPFPFPNTPPFGTTPPFPFDPRIPSSSGPFPCTFWRMHPTMIWGLMGWNGNTVSNTFGVGNVGGFGAGMNLLEALSNTRTDGFGELYREGTAALLNSMASNSFPFSAQQVKLSFGRAALSSNGDAAGAQAQLFKMANEGHYKPASP